MTVRSCPVVRPKTASPMNLIYADGVDLLLDGLTQSTVAVTLRHFTLTMLSFGPRLASWPPWLLLVVQMNQHIAPFMKLTALGGGRLASILLHSRAQRLTAIEHV